MSEKTIEQALVSSMDKITQWIEQGGKYVSEQVPDIASQYVQYVFWGNVFYAVLYLLTVVGLVYVFNKCLALRNKEDEQKKYWYDRSDLPPVAMVGSVILSIIFGCCFTYSVQQAVKAKVAPKIVVIEKLSELAGLKKNCN
jgi:hypothetical protein